MQDKKLITWADIDYKISQMPAKLKEVKHYGIPRGGQYIAARLNPVDTPEEADVIVDDLIDSGKTINTYREQYPDKQFWVPFNKMESDLAGKWLVFPWEIKEEPVEDNFRRVLEYIGEDPDREGLQDTPKRYLKFLREFLSPPDFNFTTFDGEGMDEMIVQTHIPFYSLCEHHLAPFYGHAHVAYIPGQKIVGLSKLARVVETFSRRLQNQERITTQVAECLMAELEAEGVAVVIKAQHLCMSMRGVKKHDTRTVTSKLLGHFKNDDKARQEFFNLIEL